MNKRRNDTRYLCSQMVALHWADEARVMRIEIGVLENISVSGARVQTEAEVSSGVPICMLAANQEFRGTVCYCCRSDSYVMGIEFDADSQWSQWIFEPEHLVD